MRKIPRSRRRARGWLHRHFLTPGWTGLRIKTDQEPRDLNIIRIRIAKPNWQSIEETLTNQTGSTSTQTKLASSKPIPQWQISTKKCRWACLQIIPILEQRCLPEENRKQIHPNKRYQWAKIKWNKYKNYRRNLWSNKESKSLPSHQLRIMIPWPRRRKGKLMHRSARLFRRKMTMLIDSLGGWIPWIRRQWMTNN